MVSQPNKRRAWSNRSCSMWGIGLSRCGGARGGLDRASTQSADKAVSGGRSIKEKGSQMTNTSESFIGKPTPFAEVRPKREPDFIVGDDKEKPYLLRWHLIPRNSTFNIYYHRFLRDDDDRALHDHPWPSVSIMTHGVLREVTPSGSRIICTGDMVFREPNFTHRIELIDGDPAETLFITGPKVREWGFHCPNGWVHWSDFVDRRDTGAVGQGCGEHG